MNRASAGLRDADGHHVHGIATVHHDDPLLSHYPDAQLIVRVVVELVFPNCPRYIHKMRLLNYSVYAPRVGHVAPEPDWKRMEVFRDALPRHDKDEPSASW